jgi:hypothetical protein
MLLIALEGGFLSGFHLGGGSRGVSIISHLLFAYNTILFSDATAERLTYIWYVLPHFGPVSGLKVNFGKNELILVGKVEGLEELAALLCCKLGSLPITMVFPWDLHLRLLWCGI